MSWHKLSPLWSPAAKPDRPKVQIQTQMRFGGRKQVPGDLHRKPVQRVRGLGLKVLKRFRKTLESGVFMYFNVFYFQCVLSHESCFMLVSDHLCFFNSVVCCHDRCCHDGLTASLKCWMSLGGWYSRFELSNHFAPFKESGSVSLAIDSSWLSANTSILVVARDPGVDHPIPRVPNLDQQTGRLVAKKEMINPSFIIA